MFREPWTQLLDLGGERAHLCLARVRVGGCAGVCSSQKAKEVKIPGGQRQEGAGSQAFRVGRGQLWLNVWVP